MRVCLFAGRECEGGVRAEACSEGLGEVLSHESKRGRGGLRAPHSGGRPWRTRRRAADGLLGGSPCLTGATALVAGRTHPQVR